MQNVDQLVGTALIHHIKYLHNVLGAMFNHNQSWPSKVCHLHFITKLNVPSKSLILELYITDFHCLSINIGHSSEFLGQITKLHLPSSRFEIIEHVLF